MIQIRKGTLVFVAILLAFTTIFAIAQVQENAHQEQKREDIQRRLEGL